MAAARRLGRRRRGRAATPAQGGVHQDGAWLGLHRGGAAPVPAARPAQLQRGEGVQRSSVLFIFSIELFVFF